MAVYGGLRSLRALWPVLLVAGGSFAAGQFIASNLLDYALTDVLSSLTALIVTLGFLKLWHPAPSVEFAIRPRLQAVGADIVINPNTALLNKRPVGVAAWQGWIPWLVVSAVVIAWTHLKIFAIGQSVINWPGLHNMVAITLYHDKPYAAVWVFQPLATGTAILLSAMITAAIVGIGPRRFIECIGITWRQSRLAIFTVALIVALAYVMNYSGLNYTLGLGVASVGVLFPLLSPFLGWVAVFLSGSDTSGNALFGNLQVVAANQLGLNPVLIAATNSSGGVMGKMISPQNIATGVTTTALKGQEGVVFARTFPHSIILTLLLGGLVLAQQYLFPWIIPIVAAAP
jgi:lactate permease